MGTELRQTEVFTMKKIMYIYLYFAMVMGLIHAVSAQAIEIGDDNWFEVTASGPISTQVGNQLILTIEILNEDYQQHPACELTAVVIDPFDGTRVLGPKTFKGPECIVLNPGQSVSTDISLGPFESESQNRTLSVVLLVTDDYDVVRGAGGWGFVVE